MSGHIKTKSDARFRRALWSLAPSRADVLRTRRARIHHRRRSCCPRRRFARVEPDHAAKLASLWRLGSGLEMPAVLYVGLRCEAATHRANFVANDPSGCVKTPKGRERMGILFPGPIEFARPCETSPRHSRFGGRSFYVLRALRRFHTAKTPCGQKIGAAGKTRTRRS
jgi:hypothetical protein